MHRLWCKDWMHRVDAMGRREWKAIWTVRGPAGRGGLSIPIRWFTIKTSLEEAHK